MRLSVVPRFRLAVALGASLAALASVVPATRAGAAALPVVHVTPAKKLVDLQNVTITGSGFAPNIQVGTVECGPGALAIAGCSLSTLILVRTDANGMFSLTRYVRRIILVGTKRVDCASTKGCIVGAGNVSDQKQANGQKVFFDPKVPAKVAQISVSPNTNLVDHELVTVSGAGFAPGGSVYLSECLTPKSGTARFCGYATQRYLTARSDGTFRAANFALERRQIRYVKGKQTVVNCARIEKLCEIQATSSGAGGTVPAKAGLRFDPKAPAATAVVQLPRSAQLKDLDAVKVSGAGFLPGYTVSLQECAGSAAAPQCDYGTSRAVAANLQGRFTLTYYPRRVIVPSVSAAPAGLDCVVQVGGCRLFVQGSEVQQTVRKPLRFDPAAPLAARTISATPDTGLSDNQHITVTIGGFTPFEQVQITECSSDAITENNLSYCDYNASVAVTPTAVSGVQTGFDVRAAIGGQSGPVDCTAAAGACILVVISANGYDGQSANIASTSLAFAP